MFRSNRNKQNDEWNDPPWYDDGFRPSPYGRLGRWLKPLLSVLVVVALLVVCVAGAPEVWEAGRRFAEWLWELWEPPPDPPINVERYLSEASELVTVKYTHVALVPDEKSNIPGIDILGKTEVVYGVHGEV